MGLAFFSSMPYDSNDDLPQDIKNALPAKAQTIYRKAFNGAYDSYVGDEEKAIATAWTAVKTKYAKKNDKWVLIKTVESKVVSGGIAFNPDTGAGIWTPVAKVGQEGLVSPGDQKIIYTEEALRNSVGTWKGGGISFNHDIDRIWAGESILDAKFEYPYLFHQLSEAVRAKLKDESISGCSIEGIPGEITKYPELEDAELKQVEGSKLTLMEYPLLPACKPEEGCGVVSSSVLEEINVTPTMSAETETSVSSEAMVAPEDATKSFDIFVMNNVGVTVKIGTDTVYGSKKQLKDKEFVKTGLMQRAGYYGRDNLQFYDADTAIKIGDAIPNGSKPIHAMTVVISNQEPKLVESDNRHLERETENIKLTSRGGDAEGMIKDEPIAYTGEQVKEMVASAVGEAETNLKNQQEVDSTALKDAEGKLKEKLEVKHAAELKEASELAYRKAEAITTFKAKFNPSEEVLKQAEGLDPGAIEFVVGLDLPTQEGHGGVTSGSPKGEETPEERAKSIKTRFHKALGHGVTEE
jgi:cation transport regulator